MQEFLQPEPQIGEITDKVAEELKNENEGVVMESLVSKVKSKQTAAIGGIFNFFLKIPRNWNSFVWYKALFRHLKN